MKILLTGGGSGGHFYPVIAVAEALKDLQKEQHIVKPTLYYMAPEPYNKRLLFDNEIIFKKNPTGKLRRYFSLLNISDTFKTFWGVLKAVWTIFYIYPDAVFSKGGYGSFPAVFAAKLFRIPVIIHESDSVPGKTNLWAGKFAKRVAVSWPESAEYFPKEKVAFTGNPIRKSILQPIEDGAKKILKLEDNLPVVLVLGGSLGAQKINDTIIDSLPEILEFCQIIHQTGKGGLKDAKSRASAILYNSEKESRYKVFDYLNDEAMRMAAGVADLVVSRAGSTIFEIANWSKPSIIIPISKSNGDHQRKNAYGYARSGACIVIEEPNLNANILTSEIKNLLADNDKLQTMSQAAQKFSRKDAAKVIAQEIFNIALGHEK
ncbi:MAG: UDP-N-acetylglucosamine--N-acetylmuramyl-(pentapeptide) pyrophosphoryl-undecaprenol N-acetylglucosamine transferase [Candidatus Paceibacterota bacterium]|nr:MAG: UDP-N-acetylglucosamine--N-acetylmuramyl-(pentapeptide) pyrophosphoryl-undecaprenol N-acetylglucosamine transferase [Candidatus Paceibacterota bacterium]